jgi:hypothetical protein
LIATAVLLPAGASKTKWAIEYEEPAGEAFGENHPEAAVFVENCNVILKYDNCLSCICLFMHCTFHSFLSIVLQGSNG